MISIVMCSIDNTRFAAASANLSHLLRGEEHEIHRILDARSMCEGYNRAIPRCHGDVIIFCHDDIEFLAEDFAKRVLGYIERFDILGSCGTNLLTGPQWIHAGPPHIFGQTAIVDRANNCYDVALWGVPTRCIAGMTVMDGVVLCMKRRVIETLQFDEQTFQGFHLYDLDFTLRAYKAGFSLAVVNDWALIHASWGNWDDKWKADAQRFIAKHGAEFKPISPRRWNASIVKVKDKADALRVMTPDHWRSVPEICDLRESPR